MSTNWPEYLEACKNAMYPDFPEASSEASEESEMCFLLLVKGEEPCFNLEIIPKIYASSYESLWKKYWAFMGISKKDQPKVHGKKYQEAFRKMAEDPEGPKTKIFPVLLTSEIYLASRIWSFFGGIPMESKVSKVVAPKPVPPKSITTAKVVAPKKTSDLPRVQLVHIPSRKAWPYALMGETKRVKDFLKFSDHGEKISAYVSNVNSELGPGWNLKEEAKEMVEEQDEKMMIVTLVTLDEFKSGVHEWS